MTVTSTTAKFIEIVGNSSGITSAPTNYPGALNTVDLPCAIVYPGPADWNEQAISLLNRHSRTYIIRVYVAPTGQGAGTYEGVQACFAPMNALGLTLLGNTDLDGTVDHIVQPFTDTGVTVLPYAGQDYHGFEFQVRVIDKTT